MRTPWPRLRTDERGSASIEAAIVMPAFMLFVGLLIFAGRTAIADQGMQNVAADAARAASLARTPAEAHARAVEAVEFALANNNLRCASSSIELDTSGLDAAVGTVGTVTATVTCQINLSDLAVPGVPGSHTVSASMVSPVDAWRSRSDGFANSERLSGSNSGVNP